MNGDADVVSALLANGADVNARDMVCARAWAGTGVGGAGGRGKRFVFGVFVLLVCVIWGRRNCGGTSA